MAPDILSPAQQAEPTAYRDSLDPATIGCETADLQNRLLLLAKEKTEQLDLASILAILGGEATPTGADGSVLRAA